MSLHDRGAFVPLGDHGARLLVVRAGKARFAAFLAGTTVKVSGTLVIPPDNPRLRHERATSRTSMAWRVHAPAVVKANVVRYDG